MLNGNEPANLEIFFQLIISKVIFQRLKDAYDICREYLTIGEIEWNNGETY